MTILTQTKPAFSRCIELIPEYRRLFVPIMIFVLLTQPSTRELTLRVMSDAFWQVAVFVAMTLTAYHLVANKLSAQYLDQHSILKGRWKIVFAAVLGSIPGCGGAIVIITQFVSGSTSFGAVVAVLTATMGDAAFLLIAAQPKTGLLVIFLSLSVGIFTGLVVDQIHGKNFLKPFSSTQKNNVECCHYAQSPSKRIKWQGVLWQWLAIPCSVIGVILMVQLDVAAIVFISKETIQIIGATIAILSVLLWSTTTEVIDYESMVAEDKKSTKDKTFQRVALDTNFVTSWVVVAFLAYELLSFYTELNLSALFNAAPALTPFIGVLIGVVPGCAPQIITTSLYLSSAIPLSTQIGNAISNDGDALFPAIAFSPKVAVVATLYSAIPATITAYVYYLVFES